MAHLRLLEGGNESPWLEIEKLPENVVAIAPRFANAHTEAATQACTCQRCSASYLGQPTVGLCPACEPYQLEWLIETVRALKNP